MCGRYTLTADAESIQLAFNLDDIDGWTAPRFNIAPTQQVAVITDREPKSLSFLRWGLVPSLGEGSQDRQSHDQRPLGDGGGETVVPYRVQTAALLDPGPTVTTSGRRRARKKIPMYIQHAERDLFAFAGLWESWKDPEGDWLQTCAILTTEANEKVRPIHHRMTVILEPKDYELWLSPRELLPPEWQPLMAGPAPEQLKFHEVSTAGQSPGERQPDAPAAT